MDEAAEPRIAILRTRPEIEQLRGFWDSCNPGRDADLEFYLFIADIYPETVRPHVVALYDGDAPKALLAGRLDVSRVQIKAGYAVVPVPKMRILRFVHGGCLGEVSDATAKLLVGSAIESLAACEADVVMFEHLEVNSPLVSCARSLPSWLCSDRIIYPEVHRTCEISDENGFSLTGFSKKERYNLRRSANKLSNDYPRKRIECFTSPDEVARLMRDAECVAQKSYQRGIGVGFNQSSIVRSRLEFEARYGWLRAYVLYLDDAPCAFWIGSLRDQVFLSDYLAFDPAYAKYGPGLYLMLEVIEELSGHPSDGPKLVKKFDFGIGDAAYKKKLSNSSRQESTVYIFAPRLKAVGVNALRSSAGITNRLVKHWMAPFLGSVKRAWRARVTQRE